MTSKSSNHSFAKFISFLIIIAFLYIVNSNGNTTVPDRPLTKSQKEEKQKKLNRDLKISNIPDRVYKNTLKNDKLANILTSQKKIIYHAYLENCTESNVFLADLESLMKKHPDIQYKYYYYPDPQERSTLVTCNVVGSTDCIQNYLFQNCSNNLCIINPQKKQIMKIPTKDYRLAFDRINKYKNW